MSGYNNNELITLVRRLEMNDPDYVMALKRAVNSNPIIYGTAGKKGNAAGLHSIMADSINGHNSARKADNSALKTPQERLKEMHRKNSQEATNNFTEKSHASFQSGSRGQRQRAENLQMMDMWYGDGHLGDKANPTILKFIKIAAKLSPLPGVMPVLNGHQLVGNTGIDRKQHPYFIYTAAGIPEGKGWQVHPVTTSAYGNDEFRKEPMTATKELSRITRWLVGHFGGKIILDIHNVYCSQVFCRGRFGDTEMESCALFPYVTPGSSSGSWGNGGKIEIQFDGQPMIPSKLLFMTSWGWGADVDEEKEWAKKINYKNFAPALKFLFAMEKFQAPDYTEYLRAIEKTTRTIDLELALWNKFPDFPPNFDFAGGLRAYVKKLDQSYVEQYGAYHGGADDVEIAAALDDRDKREGRGKYKV